jgi:glycosyltransferase involved in cell wall biosynthesis
MVRRLETTLVLCRSLPHPRHSAGELRFFRILEHLRRRSEHVRIFAEEEDNRALFSEWDVHDIDELPEHRSGATLALLEFWYMGRHISSLRREGVPTIVDSVDVEFVRRDREKQLLGLPSGSYRHEKKREIRAYREADMVWAVSKPDRRVISRFNPWTAVVPATYPVLRAPPRRDQRNGVCFVGSYKHQPNVDGLRWYRDAVLPRVSDLPHRFIGHDAPEDIRELAGFLGGVEDSSRLVGRARVSIAPLRYGAGLKGKVLEAFCCGTPVVTTRVGDEGYGGGSVGAAIVTDDPAGFAAAVRAVHDDPEEWERLSRNGLALARSYSPEVAEERMDRAVDQLMSRSRVDRWRKRLSIGRSRRKL